MFPIEVGRGARCGGKLPGRQDKGREHPRVRLTNVFRVILQRGFERKIARRKHSGVINRVREERTKRSGRHEFKLNGAIWPFVNHCSERRGEIASPLGSTSSRQCAQSRACAEHRASRSPARSCRRV